MHLFFAEGSEQIRRRQAVSPIKKKGRYMRTIVICLIIIAISGGYAYHRHNMELERRRQEEIRLAREKAQREAEEKERRAKEAAEREKQRVREEKRQAAMVQIAALEQELAARKTELAESKKQLAESAAKFGSAGKRLDKEISALTGRIDALNAERQRLTETLNSNKYRCYARCIKFADFKFTHRFTSEGKHYVQIPGGKIVCVYCGGKEGFHPEYHNRALNYERRRYYNFPVRYECSTHGQVWTEKRATAYAVNFQSEVDIQRRIRTAETKLQESRAEIESLKKQEKSRNDQRDTATGDEAELQKRITAGQAEIDRIQTEVRQLRHQLE